MHKHRTFASSPHRFFAKAPVFGFARSFVSGRPIPNATIKILEDETSLFQTDNEGRFGPIWWTVGAPITLKLEKNGSWWTGYHATQTPTIIVPPEGINNANYLYNVSFQVPSNMAFTILSWGMGVTEDPDACQIAVTVTPPNTTMDDIPQGEPGVDVSLEPDPHVRPYYLGILPFIHKTNFFWRQPATSLDGGVIFPNVPEGVYTLKARKGGRISEITVTASKGVLVNASPPQGPII